MPFDPEEVANIGRAYNPPGFEKLESITPKPRPNLDQSVLASVFATENNLYSVGRQIFRPMPTGDEIPNFDVMPHIPPDLIDFADRFVKAKNPEQAAFIEQEIRRELEHKAVMAEHPWQSLAAAIPVTILDFPGVFMPGGTIYKGAKGSWAVGKTALSAAGAGALSQAVNETILHQSQYARTAQESHFNILSAGLFSAAIGGGVGALVGPGLKRGATKEIAGVLAEGNGSRVVEWQPDGSYYSRDTRLIDGKGSSRIPNADEVVIVDKDGNAKLTQVDPETGELRPPLDQVFQVDTRDIPFDADYLKETRALANIPEIAQRASRFNPLMRLKSSKFGISRAFADDLFESMLGTRSTDAALEAAPRNLETMIRKAQGELQSVMLEYNDIMFRQRGIEGGPLTRAGKYVGSILKNEALPGLNVDEFNFAVARSIRDGFKSGTPEVIEAAKLLHNKIIEPITKKLIEQGHLDEGVSVTTAVNYLTRYYNLARINEDPIGFKSLLRDYFTQVNEKLKEVLPKVDSFSRMIEVAEKKVAMVKELEGKIEKEVKRVERQRAKLAPVKNELTSIKRQLNTLEKEGKANIALLNKNKNSLTGLGKELREVNTSLRRKQTPANKRQAELRKTFVEGDIKRKQQEAKELKSRVKKINSQKKSLELKQAKLSERGKTLGRELNRLRVKASRMRQLVKREPVSLLERQKEAYTKEMEKLKIQNVMGTADRHLLTSEGAFRRIQTPEEIDAAVNQTFFEITSMSDEKLANPMYSMLARDETKAKPLNPRTLLIPDNVLEPYLINDASHIMDRYIKTMVPLVESTEWATRRGFETPQDLRTYMLQALRDEFDAKLEAASPKERAKLKKEFASDKEDIVQGMDIILGVHGSSLNSDSGFSKVLKFFRQWNQLRFMNSVVLASIPDVGTLIMRHGLMQHLQSGLRPVLKNSALRKAAKEELQCLGLVCNTEMGLRLKSYADTGDLTVARGRFGRFMDKLLQWQGNVTGINQWNDIMQEMAGTTAFNFIFSRVKQAVETGKIAKDDAVKLARRGIGKEHYEYIYRQFEKHGEIVDGVHLGNVRHWEFDGGGNSRLAAFEADTYKRVQEAVLQEVRSTVVEPGVGDKPLFMTQEYAKSILQFKSFALASQSKVLMSAIQDRRDMDMLSGIIAMLSLGALSYVSTSIARGNEIDLSLGNMTKEAVDRSGILAVFQEFGQISAKLGLIPGLGVSRYQSRGQVGGALGPTVGAVEDVAQFLSKIAQANNGKPLTTKDTEALLRLMPYQNLWYAHRLFRKFNKTLSTSVGIEDADKEARRG